MESWTIPTAAMASLSLLITTLGILVSITQKTWKKRDGVLLFNIFIVDVIFSIFNLAANLCVCGKRDQKNVRVVLDSVMMFVLVMSWGSQCLITINRYVVINYPFKYKAKLNRSRLCMMVAAIWIFVGCLLILSITFKSDLSYDRCIVLEFVLPTLPWLALIGVVVLHVSALLIIYILEFCLWRTARGHESRYRSITGSLKAKEPTNQENRRVSITQTFQRRFSFSPHGIAVRRTPLLLLAAHALSIAPYLVVCIMYCVQGNGVFKSEHFRNTCNATQVLISLRPIIGVINHLSRRTMKRFVMIVRKVLSNTSSELYTDYYIENHKEVENMRLRRGSAHSMVTDTSIV